MKLSKIYIIVWFLIGIALAFYGWRWTVVWVISGFLNDLSEHQYNKEIKSKKKISPYIN